MTSNYSAKEWIFQERLLEKYGSLPEFADLVSIVRKIQANVATDDDYAHYTAKVETLINKFKSDLRKIQPEQYQKQDILLITSMIEANSAAFENNTESFSKKIPADTVKSMLALERKTNDTISFSPPKLTGFLALSRYSENLSPQQQQSQFGLDYSNSPYIYQQGDQLIRQPFVFVVKTPTQQEIEQEPDEKIRQKMQQQMNIIRNEAKLPIDPRILVKIVKIAEDSQDPESGEIAKIFLKKYLNTDQIMPIFRDSKDLQIIDNCLKDMAPNSPYYDSFKKVSDQINIKAKINESPYTGNTAPQFGVQLEDHNPYADVVQERAINVPVELPPGTKIYLQVPRKGTDPLSADRPAGYEQIEIAVYSGKEWSNSLVNTDIDLNIELALKTIPEEARKAFITKNRVDRTVQIDDNRPLEMTNNLKRWQEKGSLMLKAQDQGNEQIHGTLADKTLECIATHSDKILSAKANNVNFKPLLKRKSSRKRVLNKA